MNSGVTRPVWWFGTADTCAAIDDSGNASDVPHWIVRRSTASVSSLVQACGAQASIPASKRAPPLAHDSNRISGKRSTSRR